MKKIAFLLLFLSSFCFAEKISFPLYDTFIPIDWDEKWFGEKSSFEYNHRLARVACYFSDAAYADVKGSPKKNNLLDAYKEIGIKESEIEFHYDIDYSNAMWGNDQCAYSIASKKIKSSKGEQNLIFVVVRGTPFNANEWISNLNVSDANQMQQSIHQGFAKAASIIHTALISYMLRHRIDPTDSFLFMTGHSRGAAVSNMLSAVILKDNFFKPENIYTFTFASPNVSTSENCKSEKYGFIWNIVNAEDIVPTVPMNRDNWKFKKYGHVKAFVNQTNTASGIYRGEYLPRINAVCLKLIGREYKPFTTGPFLPILVTRLMESLSKDVEKYYTGFMNIHARASNLMNKLFPEKKDDDEEEAPSQHSGGLGSWFISWLNKRTNGLLDYASVALGDMHVDDVYLSYMLALDEDEAFSESEYSLVVAKGYEEIGIFDSEDKLMARVIDGKIIYSDMKFPVVLCPSLGTNVIIGYPSNLRFKIAVTDETLFPTPVSLTVEYFDAAGVYKESETKKLYPSRNRVYVGELGRPVLENRGLYPSKVSKDEGKKIVENASLYPRQRFIFVPELYTNTDFNLGFGLHIGTPLVYGSVMGALGIRKFGQSGSLSFGIGNQQSIWHQIKFDTEIFAKCLWLEKDEENDDGFMFVPELRTSLSMKLIGRLRFFSAGVFDFQINGYNDAAFENKKRHTTIHTFRLGDSICVAPSIQFGLRF